MLEPIDVEFFGHQSAVRKLGRLQAALIDFTGFPILLHDLRGEVCDIGYVETRLREGVRQEQPFSPKQGFFGAYRNDSDRAHVIRVSDQIERGVKRDKGVGFGALLFR